MKYKKYLGKVVLLTIAAAMSLSMSSCGAKEKEIMDSSSGQKEFVYVPEYIDLESKDLQLYDVNVKGNSVYGMSLEYNEESESQMVKMIEYNLATKEKEEMAIALDEKRGVNCWQIDEEKHLYTLENGWEDSEDDKVMMQEELFLCKYNAQGEVMYEHDVTELLSTDGNISWISSITVDEQGRIYLSSERTIYLFDAQGKHWGTIEIGDGWLQGIGVGKNAKVYVNYYLQAAQNSRMTLAALDFDNKKLGETYENYPDGIGIMAVGIEKDFLESDRSKLYEYDMETQSSEVLLDWVDCDINGSYVQYVGTLENGNLLAILRDWNTGKTEIVYLTKKASSEIATKKEIIIGTIFENSSLQSMAVEFNKSSDTWRVKIKSYMDDTDWSDDSYQDAIAALNNDILSKNNCPDILDLSNLNVKQLAEKGVLEDLLPYLEQSDSLSKEAFLENIIEGYTFNDKLVCIPSSYTLTTIAAKAADVGTEMGWTLEEMIDYAKKNPQASLFDNYTQDIMMSIMMQYNQDEYVNWETGECNFESEEFKNLLAFIKDLPEEYNWTGNEASTPVRIQAGEVLLDMVYIYDLQSIQQVEAMYNEPVTYIGYPNAQGNSGCYINANDMYAIAAKSENKSGAWEFIEKFLTSASNNTFNQGLYTNKQAMEEAIAELQEVEYVLDENGNPILDENGEKIPAMGTASIGYGDWEYTFHAPTQEEIDCVMTLAESAKPVYGFENEIYNIIAEEATGYFKGQKALEDVVAIIQSRVQVYVNENR